MFPPPLFFLQNLSLTDPQVTPNTVASLQLQLPTLQHKNRAHFTDLRVDEICINGTVQQYELHLVWTDQIAESPSTVHLPLCLGRWES